MKVIHDEKFNQLFDRTDANYKWFQENYSELVERFDGEFVAIITQKVIDHDVSLDALVSRLKKEKIKDWVVEFVTRERLDFVL